MTGAFATPEEFNLLSYSESTSLLEAAVISGYEIVHAIRGRIRLRIPRLADDAGYTDRLTHWLTTLLGVTQVNVNSLAKSVTICYQDNTPAAGFVQGLLAVQPLSKTETDDQGSTPNPLPELPQVANALKPWFYRLAVTLLQVTGVAFLVIGVVGVLLPILPGTPFLILASFCFLATSELSSNY